MCEMVEKCQYHNAVACGLPLHAFLARYYSLPTHNATEIVRKRDDAVELGARVQNRSEATARKRAKRPS